MRIRGGLVATIAVAVLGFLVPGAQAMVSPAAEVELLDRTNAARAAEGLAPLAAADDLVAVARRHAQRMADEGRIFHNANLRDEVDGWQVVGENVGRAGSIAEVHDAFMASPAHRANVVESRFTQAGMGVVDHNGELWVVEVFRQPMAAAAPAPAPAPRAATTPRANPVPRPAAAPAPPAAAPPATTPAAAAPAPPTAAPTGDRVVPELAGAPGPRAQVQGRLLTVEARDAEQVGALALVALLLLALVATMTTKATVAELVAPTRR